MGHPHLPLRLSPHCSGIWLRPSAPPPPGTARAPGRLPDSPLSLLRASSWSCAQFQADTSASLLGRLPSSRARSLRTRDPGGSDESPRLLPSVPVPRALRSAGGAGLTRRRLPPAGCVPSKSSDVRLTAPEPGPSTCPRISFIGGCFCPEPAKGLGVGQGSLARLLGAFTGLL